MFQCQECKRTFRTVNAAERAVSNGCPRCGGTDIDLAPLPFDEHVRQALARPRKTETFALPIRSLTGGDGPDRAA